MIAATHRMLMIPLITTIIGVLLGLLIACFVDKSSAIVLGASLGAIVGCVCDVIIYKCIKQKQTH